VADKLAIGGLVTGIIGVVTAIATAALVLLRKPKTTTAQTNYQEMRVPLQ